MAWVFGVDDVLAAIRTQIGASITVGAHTLTWVYLVEGPPQRWLDHPDTQYPLIILQPSDVTPTDGPALVRLELPVEITIVIAAATAGSTGVAPAMYKTARLVGEAVMAKLMDAGPHLGVVGSWLTRALGPCGVDYETCERNADHGLLAYKGTLEFVWYEAQP